MASSAYDFAVQDPSEVVQLAEDPSSASMAGATWDQYLAELDECEEVKNSSSEGTYSGTGRVAKDEWSDDEADVDESHEAGTISEKKRVQNELFKNYAAVKTEEITEKEVRQAMEGSKDEVLSIRDILAKQENSTRITNPRDYQTELFQRAKQENIIAVLDTGSGKTHIATLLLRHILDNELAARARGEPHKIAFFLVDSVNLVFQQSNVLQYGLDHPVQGICGAMGTSLWQKATWDKHFEKYVVIVCTAEVLVQCLMHSFISIRRINLLIFDEAHHAKDNHPYARLIKDYYLHEPEVSQRPRIFGMTASPVDANVDIKQAAEDLEILLHSKIATTSDPRLLSKHIPRPQEEVTMYPKLPPPFETPFYQEMQRRYGEIPVFSKFFQTAKIFSSELGRWASDAYWSFALSEEEGRKMELRKEREYNKTKEGSIDKLNKEIAQLREAAEYVGKHEFGLPSVSPEDLSSKVLMLDHWLSLYFTRPNTHRCIVFVERRQTARLLNMIFSAIRGPKHLEHLRSDLLVGSTIRNNDLSVSLRTQIMTVAKFRRGDLNCLFSTSVAEEGLDIPQCNLVVRFDLYRTMIAYVQSRGRARHHNSKYVHMVERGNFHHTALLFDARNREQIMRAFCDGLPRDRLLDEDPAQFEKLLAKEHHFPSYTEAKSGAKLTFRSSQAVLAHFVATLPDATQEMSLQPTYVVEREGGKYICEVLLPECAPIISMRGKPQRRKAIAKCSAAFDLCLELRKREFLDDTLLPTLRRQLPAMRNAFLAISAKKKDQYLMRIKPEFWQFGQDTVPGTLYLTVIDVSSGLERPHQPIGLVTRQKFPQLPRFPIFLVDGQPTEVTSVAISTPFPVTEKMLERFTGLTLQVYADVFAKQFKHEVEKMSYWIVPLRSDRTENVEPDAAPEPLIDWEQVDEIYDKKEYRWTKEMPNDFLTDRYLVDLNDGGRRFYTRAVVDHLKATDPVPGSAPRYEYMNDILDYSISLWKKSREKWRDVWDRSQPVVEVEKIPFRRNFLARVETDEDEVKWKPVAYVCPQPLKISALTTRFVAMCYVFPAIIHRFEAYMVAMDACTRLDLKVSPRLALEALTKDSDNSEDHGEEKINFKSGMGPNYERLEFMGDCFLKMATSLSTFVQQPDENEFEFHVRRMCMLCNKNMFESAKELKLYEYVRTMAFSRRTWYPEELKLEKGKGANRTGRTVIKHQLGDKSIADVCEALIGAAFMEHNKPGSWDGRNWDEAVKAVKIMVNSEDHLMEKFSDYYAAYEMPKYQVAEATAAQLDLAEKIEQKHPYHFKYPRLLRSAFIHPSQAFMWEKIPNYQRLEFLGDSLLDQVFIMHLFYNYPDKDPQWLTEHKMPMVSNRFLSALAVKLGFHTHIRQNNSTLTSQIQEWVADVQDAEREANGAVDYWVAAPAKEPPKCLADVVEAYVAAMFVDSCFDFSVVQDFFDCHIKHYFEDMSLYDHVAGNHPNTRLTRRLQDELGCRDFRVQAREQDVVLPGGRKQVIAMVMIHGKIHFDAVAASVRYAKPKVANLALEKLDSLPQYEYRRLYGCDCEDETIEADEVGDGQQDGGAKELTVALEDMSSGVEDETPKEDEGGQEERDGVVKELGSPLDDLSLV
ncbi:dicer-like protein-like protein 1 [Sporormia fimetaria CBS 119925]|uniref:Dicer-like protein 1 n=1 Tax=Sporormia fimetaria CBS 119925 TaxID=1340428 RepID=A0A6A6V2W4_9PLEO|nr:dicer-like protein-like protein 1 [Sporormia fimetaria CBS 119925]